jgi:hypothetical protein
MYEYEMAQQRIAALHDEARRVRLADEVTRRSGSSRRAGGWRGRGRRRLTAAGSGRAQPVAQNTRIPQQRRPAELAGRRS